MSNSRQTFMAAKESGCQCKCLSTATALVLDGGLSESNQISSGLLTRVLTLPDSLTMYHHLPSGRASPNRVGVQTPMRNIKHITHICDISHHLEQFFLGSPLREPEALTSPPCFLLRLRISLLARCMPSMRVCSRHSWLSLVCWIFGSIPRMLLRRSSDSDIGSDGNVTSGEVEQPRVVCSVLVDRKVARLKVIVGRL